MLSDRQGRNRPYIGAGRHEYAKRTNDREDVGTPKLARIVDDREKVVPSERSEGYRIHSVQF